MIDAAAPGYSPMTQWPFGLPLLQSLRRDPLGAVQRLHEQHGDVASLTILATRIYYFFRPEAARQILVDHHEEFAKERRQLLIFQSVQGVNVLTTEGRSWERQRRILTPGFAPKRVAEYMNLMAAAADDGIRLDLPGTVGGSELVDVDRLTTRVTMDVILRALFTYRGVRKDADALSHAVRSLTRQSMRELFWPFMPPAWLPYPGRNAKMRNLRVVRDLVWSQIRARREAAAAAHADILGMFLAARDDQASSSDAALSDEEINDNCMVIFGAGHDTSASALTWWIGLMAAHPEVAAKVRAELWRSHAEASLTPSEIVSLPFLNATIKEAMRLYPPSIAMFSRIAPRDVRVGDVQIARGSLVVIPIWSIHHDQRWYPDPDAFRPERFMPGAPNVPRSAYMPFGAGPHFCLGQQFAMIEMALIAARLIQLYELSLEQGAMLPEPVVDLVLKPKTRLYVRFTRRE
jgi:cytochrome P450